MQADDAGIRVLIVEDDPELGELLSLTLRRRGMRVVTTRDGITAVEEARRLDPDVAIVDIGLPHLEGHELGRQLRALQGGASRPRLIAITGDSREETRRRSQEAGFDAHIVKPAKPGTLVSLVHDLGVAAADETT